MLIYTIYQFLNKKIPVKGIRISYIIGNIFYCILLYYNNIRFFPLILLLDIVLFTLSILKINNFDNAILNINKFLEKNQKQTIYNMDSININNTKLEKNKLNKLNKYISHKVTLELPLQHTCKNIGI
jgi:hypothetical protein